MRLISRYGSVVSGRASILALVILLAAGSVARAEEGAVVLAWNDQALNAVRDERLGTPVAARLYAMVNIAIYDAVNGIDRARFGRFGRLFGRDSALVEPEGAPRRGDREAAAAAAAHAVLLALVPERAAEFDLQLAADLARLGAGGDVIAGQLWGESVGERVVELRENDGSSPQQILPGGTLPGQFRGDFTSAQFADLLPFGIVSALPYESDGPPALNSLAYAGALAEVQLLGNGNLPNAEFDAIYRFWRGGGGGARPPGEWIKIAIVVAERQETTESISDTARLFTLLGMALGDAVIPAWRGKADFRFWRPGTAIAEADSDGNPLTVADPGWVPRNGSLGSSPEHASGQSTFAGAGSTILAGFYCTDFLAFSFEGDDAITGPRAFDSFSAAAFEAGRARILAGIHFEFSNQAGQRAGRGLANEILTTRLQRLRRPFGPKPWCPQA